MKKLFLSAIPICLVSFILFGITTAILGTKSRGNANYVSQVDEVGQAYNQYISETVTNLGEWTLTDAVRPSVSLHTSGVNAYVIQSSDDDIHVRVTSNSSSSVHIDAHSEGATLNIEVCPPNVIFDGVIDFGKIFWLDDIFHGSPDTEVVIAFPKLFYDELYVEHGSGTLMIDGFNSRYNNFDIGSGRFEFSKSDQFTAEMFDVNVGSGNAVISNMQTKHYNINLGSGHYDFNGLSGTGDINMGSGNGNIAYSELTVDDGNGDEGGDTVCDLNMGSGTLNLYFPDDDSCYLYTEIGSGSVNVNAYGIEKKLTLSSDEDELLLGASEYPDCYNIDMGSGKINIRNTSEYTMPTLFEGRPDLEKIAEITGIVISTDGETVFSGAYSSVNADVAEQTEDTSMVGVVTIPQESATASGALSYDINDVTVATTSAPKVPLAPDPPKAPDPPEVPEAPSVPTI